MTPAQLDLPDRLGHKGWPVRRERTAETVSPPPQFRVVRGATDGGMVKPAMCGAEEVMVSATCLVKVGEIAETPRALGDNGASCDAQPGQSNPPQAIILCAKR